LIRAEQNHKEKLFMDKQALIDRLNKDLADEHAAIIRYLVHGYMEGEDTPLGASLVSISREEMWHFHWLGMIIGKLGGEPNFTPAPYPYDPTSRATILRSYIEYEEKLIPHYGGEAEKVDDPHIRRVLEREAWESAIHARKFQRKLDKLSPEEAAGLPGGETELPEELLDKLQAEVTSKYTEMLQHLRTSWVFQKDEIMGWKIMDQAMEKMKHLAHFAEDIAENGIAPKLKPGEIDRSNAIGLALKKALEDVHKARERHLKLREDSEVRKHSGLVINLDLTVQQEEYQGAELEDWKKNK
jgi:bacterioferritin